MFVSPPWLEAISRTYGFTPRARIAIESGGKPIGGFAWVHVVDVRGERLCSLPFSDWADPIASDYSTWRALTAGIFDENTPLSLRCLHSAVPAQDPRLLQTEQLAWHGTQLDAPLPDIHRRLSPGARRNIAAASRNGLSVVTDTGVEAMREFHRMQVLLRKHKYRMLAQPLEFFENIWARFRLADAVVTITARAGSEPIAAAVFLQWNDTLHYKFGSSLQDRLQLRPNDAIYWAGIRWAAERGLSLVDWGVSDLDQPGLLRFKRKYATDEKRVVVLRSAQGPKPGKSDVDVLLREITRLLTDESVSDDVTGAAGSVLYRLFC
ncbi:hypothetical protein GCM10025787_25280 [Saccharopolyspora rosea]|uniref:GNAT family N-acetyltransferase n=1 Tax=Saccharopolyspora rosea TaxID=524884 RepID=A0ABW3FQH7_9PSEU